jgi:hypothetical protein
MDSAGKLKLDGVGTFKDGFLDGDTCWISVDGKIAPVP